jgi:hypothetical protein
VFQAGAFQSGAFQSAPAAPVQWRAATPIKLRRRVVVVKPRQRVVGVRSTQRVVGVRPRQRVVGAPRRRRIVIRRAGMLEWEKCDPNGVDDRGIDWSYDLGPLNDTIASAAWSVQPTGLVLTPAAPQVDGMVTRVWLSGGTAGTPYTVTCRVTTGQGRTLDESARILCEHR